MGNMMEKMKQIGTIKELFISHKETKKRVQKESICIDNNGILEDKFYNKDINRSILLTSTFAYELLKNENISFKYGMLGENLFVDFNPYHYKEGTKLFINNTILEITKECTICNLISSIDKKAPKILEHNRGVFAKVIQRGTLCRNDEIKILN